jgi:NitT/TauT family transport system ATP-binding protein
MQMVSGIPQDVASPARASDPNPPFGNARRPAVRDGLQPASAPLISVSGLRKEYEAQKSEAVLALDRIDFDVADGEFVTLVGPSGCGKSTLLQILAGILPPTQGQIVLKGSPVAGPRREVGVVFQEPVLLPWLKVIDNVLLPAVVHKLDRSRYRARAMELLALVKLQGFENRYPYELSGGMQQRVAIARALLSDPAMILMDEPFGALDAMTREEMNLELLAIWARSRKTVVLITHSIQEAVFLSDRVVVLSGRPGRVVDVVDIDLPRPRTFQMLSAPEFGLAANRLRDQLMVRGGTIE